MTCLHLTVAIAALADRLHTIDMSQMPALDGVDYHIFVQGAARPVQLEGAKDRPDIRVTFLNSIGVTHSRNAAITAAQGDVILFADDDLSLATDNYAALRTKFEAAPDIDFMCGQLLDGDDRPFKQYPANLTKASRLNTAKVGTPEIAIRTKTVREAGVLFDTRFGAGSTLWLGDEYIFLCDALRAGLRGHHIDLILATHPIPSSGQAFNAETLAIRDAVLRRALGPMSWHLRCAFALRHRKKFPGWQSLLRFIRP